MPFNLGNRRVYYVLTEAVDYFAYLTVFSCTCIPDGYKSIIVGYN